MKQAAPMTAIAATQARRAHAAWQIRLAETLAVAALLALAVLVATWFSHPLIRVRAAEPQASRYLAGFYEIERTTAERFRWSQLDSTIRLFGMEQRAPVLFQARLSASRKPGQPLAQLTIGGDTPIRFPIQREWRHYMALLPAPARRAEGRTIELHSLVEPRHEDSRDLGVALDWFAATQLPRTPLERLPDTGRLAFLVALGVLGYTLLRRIATTPIALMTALILALTIGMVIATAPGALAYRLPNLWLAVLAGWLVLLLPHLLSWLQERRSLRLIPVGFIGIIAGVTLLPLQQPWSSAAGWALLLGGAILLASTLPTWPATEARPLSRRAVALSLSAITLLALTLRLIDLDGLPLGLWRDEARHGLLALRILQDSSFRPVYVPGVADIPALLFYLASVPIQLFGAHPWTIRLVPALAGALTPLALYFAARPLFGTRAALLAAALLAGSAWHLSLSRLAFAATLGPPLTLLAIGLAWRALGPERHNPGSGTVTTKTPRHNGLVSWGLGGKKPFLETALAGCATGLAIYTYHPSRLTPLLIAIAAAIRLGWDIRAWRAAVPRLVLLGVSAALVGWPLIRYGIEHRSSFSQRIGQTSIFNSDSLAGRAPLARVEENVRLNLGIWSERGDRIGRHNLPDAPMLDPLSGAAFAIGAGLALTRLRDRRALLLAAWLGIALVPGIFSIEAPHAVRTVEVIAPTMLLAAVGTVTLATSLTDEGRRTKDEGQTRAHRSSLVIRPSSIFMLIAGLLVIVLALNGARYFVAWPASPKAYEEFLVPETHAGELIQRLAAQPQIRAGSYQIYVPADAAQTDVLRYLTSGITLHAFDPNRLAIPPGEPALLIDVGERLSAPEAITAALGDGAAPLASGPISPLTGQPEWAIYGRGPEAAQAVAHALAP
jgi:4-amino-4-deoxy-L-arabinose transferase-like glycosyltransferase